MQIETNPPQGGSVSLSGVCGDLVGRYGSRQRSMPLASKRQWSVWLRMATLSMVLNASRVSNIVVSS